MPVKCVDCKGTGVIGADHIFANGGDFCNCAAGFELLDSLSGCSNCPNIDTEAKCEEDCWTLPAVIEEDIPF